jgi:hypothetical protein
MGTYQLGCEFDIVRRIGWTDEDLGVHIDEVFDRLHQADGVKEIEADANLDSGRTTALMTITTFDDEPRHVACSVLSVAIRSCGGVHVGLLSLGEEAIVRPQRNQWSGLRTPTWRIRQIDFFEDSPA